MRWRRNAMHWQRVGNALQRIFNGKRVCVVFPYAGFSQIGSHIENDVLFSNDTGILGKSNSEFSQQESNLRPSDYKFGLYYMNERKKDYMNILCPLKGGVP